MVKKNIAYLAVARLLEVWVAVRRRVRLGDRFHGHPVRPREQEHGGGRDGSDAAHQRQVAGADHLVEDEPVGRDLSDAVAVARAGDFLATASYAIVAAAVCCLQEGRRRM